MRDLDERAMSDEEVDRRRKGYAFLLERTDRGEPDDDPRKARTVRRLSELLERFTLEWNVREAARKIQRARP